METLNQAHAARPPGDSELQARIEAYRLAARMQLSAPEVVDLDAESATVHRLHGTDAANPLKAAYARNCLLARRLLGRGVRYVNLYCASRASDVDGLLNWDAHKTLKTDPDTHIAAIAWRCFVWRRLKNNPPISRSMKAALDGMWSTCVGGHERSGKIFLVVVVEFVSREGQFPMAVDCRYREAVKK